MLGGLVRRASRHDLTRFDHLSLVEMHVSPSRAAALASHRENNRRAIPA
jgi:hypothetical protein